MDIQANSYHDFGAFAELRRMAKAEDSEAAIKPVAEQFEAVFLQMMLKSMRETVMDGGLFDSESLKFYQGMMDEQLSVDLANKGGLGLSDTIATQLSGKTQNTSAREAALKHSLMLSAKDSSKLVDK